MTDPSSHSIGNTESPRAHWLDFLRQQHAEIDEHGLIAFQSADGSSAPLITPLTGLSCLAVSGEDATEFLDGQLSAPIKQLTDDQAILTAWHDPKGRARTLLTVIRRADGFDCLLPQSLVADVLPKLKMYVLRSRVRIEDASDRTMIIGCIAGGDHSTAPFIPLAGATHFGFWTGHQEKARELWQDRLEAGFSPAGHAGWRCAEIRAGIPALAPQTSGLFLPQFLNLDRFEGLSFKKGCYIGQEVIARTHYLGKVKQGLQMAHGETAPRPGSEVRNLDGKRLGHVLDGAPEGDGRWLLQLVIRLDQDRGKLYLDQPNSPEIHLL